MPTELIMPTEFISSTSLWQFLERGPRWKQRGRGEKCACARISHFLMRGGVLNMERLNSTTETEILAIPGIKKASYRYIQEALEDFRAEVGNNTWEMPDFDNKEILYILNGIANRNPVDYHDLINHFFVLAQDDYHHPEMEVMERIYYKLCSISSDEFSEIMAEKIIIIMIAALSKIIF